MANTDDVPEFPSLQPNDPAFSKLGDPSAVVTVQSGGLSRYALAYKVAADLLVQEGLAERSDLETLSGPICFLYRHFLELSLKSLAEQAGVPAKKIRRASHDLPTLWSLLQERLSEPNSGSQPDELLAFTELINEWSRYDPSSDAFRFPKNSKGEEFKEKAEEINLSRLADRMDRAYTLILGIGMAIYYANDDSSQS